MKRITKGYINAQLYNASWEKNWHKNRLKETNEKEPSLQHEWIAGYNFAGLESAQEREKVLLKILELESEKD